jgi:hypothetical protein
MPHIETKRRKSAAALTALLLASLALAACGSSGKGSSSSTGAVKLAGDKHGLEEYRVCMRANGVNLSPSTSGTGSSSAHLNTASAQYKAAARKCLAQAPSLLRPGPSTARAPGVAKAGTGASAPRTTPVVAALQQGVDRFAACMRANGVNYPTPKTSGNGPLFDTSHLNKNSAQFRAAQTKCRGLLQAVVQGHGHG